MDKKIAIISIDIGNSMDRDYERMSYFEVPLEKKEQTIELLAEEIMLGAEEIELSQNINCNFLYSVYECYGDYERIMEFEVDFIRTTFYRDIENDLEPMMVYQNGEKISEGQAAFELYQKAFSEIRQGTIKDFYMRIEAELDFSKYCLPTERESMQEIIVKIEDESYMFLQFGDGDFITEGNDSYIDYTIYDLCFNEIDGGQMDYNSKEIKYEDIKDAVSDTIEFAYDKKYAWEKTKYNREELEEVAFANNNCTVYEQEKIR